MLGGMGGGERDGESDALVRVTVSSRKVTEKKKRGSFIGSDLSFFSPCPLVFAVSILARVSRSAFGFCLFLGNTTTVQAC